MVYLDDSGEPIQEKAPVYLDDNGEPLKRETPLAAAHYHPAPAASLAEEHPYLAEAASTAGKYSKGFGKGVLDTVKGLGSAVLHPLDAAEGIVNGYGHQLGTDIPNYLRTAKDAAGEGDLGAAGGGVLGALASLIPGESGLLKTGTQAVAGDPGAGGELAENLVMAAAGAPEAQPFMATLAEKAPLVGANAAVSRARSMFNDTKAAKTAWDVAEPEVMAGDVSALTRGGVAKKAEETLAPASENLDQAYKNAVKNGRTADLTSIVRKLNSEANEGSVKGVQFGPEYASEANTIGGKVDTVSRGGTKAVTPPEPPPPPEPRPLLFGADEKPIEWPAAPEPPKWQPPPPKDVPIADLIKAYRKTSDRIPSAAYIKGTATGEAPRTQAVLDAQSAMSDALKQASPELAAAMPAYHRAKSMAELVDEMKPAPNIEHALAAAATGVGAGAALGHPGLGLGGAALTMTPYAIRSFISSPAWKLAGAAKQYQFMQMVKAGRLGQAAAMAQALAQQQPEVAQ